MSRPLIEVFDEYFARLTTHSPPPTLPRMPRPRADTTAAEPLLRAGHTAPQVAAATGLTLRTVQRLAHRLGLATYQGDRGPAASPRGRALIALQVLAELADHPTPIAEARVRLSEGGYAYSAQGLRALRARWLSDGDG